MIKNKHINCAECGVDVVYDENPKFPRKYCLNCSAKKKAEFKAITNVPEGSPRPDLEPDKWEALSEDINIKYEVPGQKPKDNGFHLTIGTIRSNALDIAERNSEGRGGINPARIIEEAKLYEKYIVTGE